MLGNFKSRCFAFAVLSIWFLVLMPAAQGQAESSKDEAIDASRIIYSVNRTPELVSEVPRAVQVVTADDIWRRGARNLSEMLMEEAGIWVQLSRFGDSSHYIRGLVGNQILILVDGVRINSAISRLGPLQYLNNIDLAAIERIEIVRGVGTVLGSDALGGVINIILKKGPGLGHEVAAAGELTARYSSVDEGLVGRAEVSGRNERWRYQVGATVRRFDDVEDSDGGDKRVPPGYDEQAFNFHLERFVGEAGSLSLSHLYSEQSDQPRRNRPGRVFFKIDPQRLSLLSLSYTDLSAGGWRDSLRVTAFINEQTDRQREIQSSAPDTERDFYNQQRMFGANLELRSIVGRHTLVYGVDFTTEDTTSHRTDINLIDGSSALLRGNLTDGATYELFAAYLQDRWRVTDRMGVTSGLRFNRFSAGGSEETDVGILDLESDDSSLTWSFGLDFAASEQLTWLANAMKGFRAPNIDDLSVISERPRGTEIGNPDLKSEQALMLELGFKYHSNHLDVAGFVYRNDLEDLHVRSTGTFEGLPFFDLDGDGMQDPDEPRVLQRQNVGEAVIEGIELEWNARLNPEWRLYGHWASTTRDDDSSLEETGRVPPSIGILGIRWLPAQQTRHPWVELVWQHAESPDRLNSGGLPNNPNNRDGSDEIRGFDVAHLRGGLSLSERFRITLAFENLTDEQYNQVVVQGQLSF